MKNARKLIPALAMLLVSAVLMSTASFAWFTMNSTVKAEGIQVTAVAPASLWISQTGAEGTWASAIDLVNENVDNPETQEVREGAPEFFSPVTIATSDTYNAWTFKELTSEASALVRNNGTLPVLELNDDDELEGSGVYADPDEDGAFVVVVDGVILTDDDDNKILAYADSKSYYQDTFKIKLDSQAGQTSKVYVNASVSLAGSLVDGQAAADEIFKSLRVAIVVNGTGATPVILKATALSDADDIVLATLGENTTSNELVTLTGGATATDVAVYAWFEGTDANCFNDNALHKNAFKIDLSFSFDAETKIPATPAQGGGSGT